MILARRVIHPLTARASLPASVIAACLCTLSLLAPSAIAASSQHPSLDSISREVMCPTCQTTLDRADNPAAARMRVYIRSKIAAGWNQQQILNGLVREYGGTSILAKPPASGSTLVVWLVPLSVFTAILLVGGFAVRRWRRRALHAPQQAASDDACAASQPSASPSN